MQRATFELQPLTCPSCINNIENKLNSTEGVYSATVSFSSKIVETRFDEKQIKAEKIGEMIKDLGYPVMFAKIS